MMTAFSRKPSRDIENGRKGRCQAGIHVLHVTARPSSLPIVNDVNVAPCRSPSHSARHSRLDVARWQWGAGHPAVLGFILFQ
jgi:hypothetical protein